MNDRLSTSGPSKPTGNVTPRCGSDDGPGLSDAPHSWQNFADGGFSKPHLTQLCGKAAPHSTQNFAVA
jgi:hypothetical protein